MADHLGLTSDERADLVAYLDGELEGDRARALDEKLGRSASARREFESLRSAWELLDLLPRPGPDASFTERTVTLAAAGTAADDAIVGAARGAARRLGVALAAASAVGVGCLTGYAAARWAWPDRTARLARDLSIAERLDDYRAVGSLDFLRSLDDSNLFKEASD